MLYETIEWASYWYAWNADIEGAEKPGAPQLEATQVDSDATEMDSMDTDDEIAAHVASPSKGESRLVGCKLLFIILGLLLYFLTIRFGLRLQ